MRDLFAKFRRAFARKHGFSVLEATLAAMLMVTTASGTYIALDSATKVEARNARASVGYQVATSEIERLRRLGAVNINTLLAQNGTSSTVTVKRVRYKVDYSAYYKAGIGATFTDACGEAASVGSSGAKYIYIGASVSALPIQTDVTGPARKLLYLDSYFATEGGDLQTASGTLRVYLLSPTPAETPQSGRTVQLYKMPAGTPAAGAQTTNGNGCVLFTGLARGSYEVRVPTTTKIDKYMNTNPIKRSVGMPSRGTITTKIHESTPVNVNFNWYTRLTTGSSTKTYVTPGAAGIANLVGPYVLQNTGLTATVPSGYLFRNNGSNMPFFPIDPAEGYGAFAGSCLENDPDDANSGNGQERIVIPSGGYTGWSGGSTLSPNPELLVPQFRVKVGTTSTSNAATGGKIQVKLKGITCGAFPSGGSGNWTRLGGTGANTDSTGYLTNANYYVLPAGKYDVCVRHDRQAGFWPFYYTEDYYGSAADVTNPFFGPNNYTYATTSTTACGNSSLWG